MTTARALGFPRESYDVLLVAGFELFESRDFEAAARIFNGLIALDPFNSAPQGALGAIREAESKPTEAMEYYDIALELNPTNQFARLHRAELRIKQGDVAAASQDLSFAAKFPGPSGDRARALLKSMKR